MKRYLSMFLTFAMLLALCACGGADVRSETPESAGDASIEIVEDDPTSEESVIEEAPKTGDEPEEPPVDATYYNPLTGEIVSQAVANRRPVAVMLNTLKKALPQSGPGDADLLLEMTEEGGITRVMAVFQDLTGVGDLGSIRSTREYFSFLAMGYDAILCHCGGSEFGISALKRNNYTSLNEFTFSDLYWRDPDRKANVGYEHSLYTSGETLLSYLADSTLRSTHHEGYTSPFVFAENGTPDGQSADRVEVSFSKYKQTQFTYDDAAGKYNVTVFDDMPYMDANTGDQVAVTNVLVVVTRQTTKADGEHQEYDLSGGKGYFACGGKHIEICWEKGGETDPLCFTYPDGTPLVLGVGSSYICVVDDDRPITIF